MKLFYFSSFKINLHALLNRLINCKPIELILGVSMCARSNSMNIFPLYIILLFLFRGWFACTISKSNFLWTKKEEIHLDYSLLYRVHRRRACELDVNNLLITTYDYACSWWLHHFDLRVIHIHFFLFLLSLTLSVFSLSLFFHNFLSFSANNC